MGWSGSVPLKRPEFQSKIYFKVQPPTKEL